jgi:hypothetical protein
MRRSSWAAADHTHHVGLGDHVCQFFATAHDLSQTLIPYFKLGLERNEACVWVTAQPYSAERALSELRGAVPDIDRLMAKGQLQIYSHDQWYLKYARLDLNELVRVWLARKDEAVGAGHAGLRISGNASFVARNAWDAFIAYEKAADTAFRGQPIAALCSYLLDTCGPEDVLDVLHCHCCSWIKHQDRWEGVAIATNDELDREAPRRRVRQESHDIAELIEELLRPHVGQTRLEGRPVRLSKQQTANLNLIITELAANAARYGALAKPDGRICVQWRILVNGSRRLQVRWTETCTSTFSVPERIGTGTRLLAERAENIKRVFEAGEMSCTFELSLGGDDGRFP